jgi:hypothetical protein
MEKIKIFFFLNFLTLNNSNSVNFKEIKNKVVTKYNYYNENKWFKYGKYILLIPIIYYPLKKIIMYEIKEIEKQLTCPNDSFFGLDYPSKDYKFKEIAKYKIKKEILQILDNDEELKNEFLIKDPNIYMEWEIQNVKWKSDNNLIHFIINTRNLSTDLKTKLLKAPIFANNEKKMNSLGNKNQDILSIPRIIGEFLIKENLKNTSIYEVEVENNLHRIYQSKEFKNKSSIPFKCPIVATEHGMINYYYQLKKNKNTKLIKNFYSNLHLFSKFLDEFMTKDEEIHELLFNIISKYDLTSVWDRDFSILEKNITNSFKDKNPEIVNNQNINDDNINEQIQLIFDKLTNIFHEFISDKEKNILKHIHVIFIVKSIWKMFNNYLHEEKLPLLPPLEINAPIITPRFWCTLNGLDNRINLKCLGGHFHFSYFSLDKEAAEATKKFIEEWVKKYYISKNPEAWSDNYNGTTHFKVSLKEHNN